MDGSAPVSDDREPGTDSGNPVGSGWPRIADYWPSDAWRRFRGPDDDAAAGSPDESRRPAWHSFASAEPSGATFGRFRRPAGRRRSRSAQPHREDRPDHSRTALACSLAIVLLTACALTVTVLRNRADPDSTGALTEPPATVPPSVAAPIGPETSGNAEASAIPSAIPISPSVARPPSRPPAGGDGNDGNDGSEGGDRDGGGGDRDGGDRDDGVIRAPVNGRNTAGFDLVQGADVINLRIASIGSDLFRVSAPDGRARPAVTVADSVVRVTPARGDGTNATTVLLNSRVRWSVRMSAGVKSGVFDLRGGRISAVELTRSARLDVSLPRPAGTLPVRMTGGVRNLRVHTPEVPIRVGIRAGAGLAVINGSAKGGVAAGTTFTPADFAGARNRIDLQALGGVGVLRVDDDA